MEENYQKGIVFKLNEKSNDYYLILENVKLDNRQYLLVMPFQDIKNITIDYTKSFVFRVEDDKSLEVEKDINVIDRILEAIK
mgnify:CR=1 FL=1